MQKFISAGRKCTIIFQPHLFSRTRDLAKEFAESLDLADEILLLTNLSCKRITDRRCNKQMIVDMMKNKNARVVTKEELMKYIEGNYLKAVKDNADWRSY